MRKLERFWSLFLSLGLILGVHRGYIALWRDTESEPYKVFPYKAAILPEQERLRLEAGIPIRDEDHLHSLIEEYLS